MPYIGPQYTSDLTIADYKPMEKHLAVQVAESTLISLIVDDKDGCATVIRALSQKDSSDDRLQCFYIFANYCWHATKQPGKDVNEAQWNEIFTDRLHKAFFNAYHKQICESGLIQRDVTVKIPGNDTTEENVEIH